MRSRAKKMFTVKFTVRFAPDCAQEMFALGKRIIERITQHHEIGRSNTHLRFHFSHGDGGSETYIDVMAQDEVRGSGLGIGEAAHRVTAPAQRVDQFAIASERKGTHATFSINAWKKREMRTSLWPA